MKSTFSQFFFCADCFAHVQMRRKDQVFLTADQAPTFRAIIHFYGFECLEIGEITCSTHGGILLDKYLRLHNGSSVLIYFGSILSNYINLINLFNFSLHCTLLIHHAEQPHGSSHYSTQSLNLESCSGDETFIHPGTSRGIIHIISLAFLWQYKHLYSFLHN